MSKIQISKVNDHIWLLDDAGTSTAYLIAGSKSAVLLDTMNGNEDVAAICRGLTDLPIKLINTHGHPDHVGGNFYFDEFYLHPDDYDLCMQMVSAMTAEGPKKGMIFPKFIPITEGETQDLGGIHLELFNLKGHTQGGLLFLLPEDRILFTGDAINRHLWMQLEGCTGMQELADNIDKLSFLKERADVIYHAHARGPEPITLMDDLRRGALELAAGKTENDKPYVYFGGEVKQHEFAPGSVIVYDPKNL